MIFGKKKKKEQASGISGYKIHVIIKRIVGKVPIVVAEFDAIQKRDNASNLIIENEKMDFKEDLDISRSPIIDFLKTKLDPTWDNQKAVSEIDNKILKLNEKIKNVKDGKITEGDQEIQVNIIDLKNEVRSYQALKYCIENEGEGSYEIVNNEGNRQMEFANINGVYYPYFHRTDVDEKSKSKITIYPDLATKRKLYKESDDRVLNDYLDANKEGFFSGMKGILIIIAVVILFVTGTILHVRVNERASEIDSIIEREIAPYRRALNEASTSCIYYYVRALEDGLINQSIINGSLIQYSNDETEDKSPTSSIVDISQNIMGER
jgi:hypothetical protein